VGHESRWSRDDYEAWLAVLRCGGSALAELDDMRADEETRRLTALNIQIAWHHLAAQESPYRHQLTDADRRTVAIARGITGDVGPEVM